MSNTEDKKKTKQWKVGISESGWSELNRFLELVNKNAKRKVRIPDILEYAVRKIDESDILKIQESVYTANDKVDIAWHEYNLQNPAKTVTRDEFLNMIVQGYSQPGRRRSNNKQLHLNDSEVFNAS